MPTFYTVHDEDATGGQIAFSTLKAARAAGYTEIRKITTVKLPIRELLCAVFNHQQYAAKQEEVGSDEAARERQRD